MASVILSPLHSDAALLARVRRIPFPVLAAAVGLLFAVVGVAVVDDYGVGIDEHIQRSIAEANADYIMGDRDPLISGRTLRQPSDRFYGVAFELPLVLVERVLGLQEDRSVLLMRHLLTHLFFIAGGFFCGLLAYRMLGSRWAGLLAMLLFLLHPRLYAHSFFNSKDIPFLVMFVIALYLTHRAFRKDTIGAFVLLGVVVGVAVNMRPFALLLLPAALAMRGLDWRSAYNPQRRKRILVTGGVFAAAVPLAIYVSHPYYWENPLRFIEGLQAFSQDLMTATNLFQGQFISPDAVPPYFIPVWFGITTPLAALGLGAVGAAAVCWRGLRAPGRIFRSGELRFLFLLLICLALPVAAAVALEANFYNGWRHMYFLWAPFCLLGAAGAYQLSLLGRAGYRIRYSRPSLLAVYGLAAAAGFGGVVYAIVSLHPHQQVYFNLLVNRASPGELERQYNLDYWEVSHLQGLKYLLEQYPDGPIYILYTPHAVRNWEVLTAAERERIVLSEGWNADFHIRAHEYWVSGETAMEPVVYQRRAYGSAYLTISAPRLVWGAGLRPGEDVYRAAYQSVTGAKAPDARGPLDLYIHNDAIYYVKENCAPADISPRVSVHIFPVNEDDLTVYPQRRHGFNNQDFKFDWRGGFFDGKCITQKPLPDYPIARIRTGQYIYRSGEKLWHTWINPDLSEQYQEIETALANSQPAVKSVFDLYLDGNRVVYYKDACAAADTQARFFLHVFPADVHDLPAGRREHGFGNLDFDFIQQGARRDGKCLAAVPLPGYEIARIRAGQYLPGGEKLWQAEFAPGGGGRP